MPNRDISIVCYINNHHFVMAIMVYLLAVTWNITLFQIVLPKSRNTWRHIWAFWYLTGIPNQNRSPDHMWPASPGTAPSRLLLVLPRSPKVSVAHSAEEDRSMAISLYSWIRDVGTATCVSGHTFTLFIYRYLYSIISLYSYMSTWHCQVLDRWQGFQTYLSR